MTGTGLALRVADLTVTGEGGRLLLTVPALSAPAGCTLGLRGPSGAGKSTFLLAIAGLIDSARGHVLWGETDVLALSPAGRRAFRAAHLGMIFQDALLFEELSARDNAALSALFAPRAQRAAIRAQSAEQLDRLGVRTQARSVATLSGGERQRVGVTRALAGGGGVLLADEPTASLDRASADALGDDLFSAARTRGQTLIVVSHDEVLLQRADRVLECADGAVRG
jgi:putative ABC transport system ATP-binding protein